MNNDHLAPISQTRKRHLFANRSPKEEDAQKKQSGGRLWQKEGGGRIPIDFMPYSMPDSTSLPASPRNPSQIPQHTKEESKRNRHKGDESGSCIIFTSTHPPEAPSTSRNRSKLTSPRECRGPELLSGWKSETLLPYSPRPSPQPRRA